MDEDVKTEQTAEVPQKQSQKINPKYANLTEMGIGAVEENTVAPKPLLEDASELDIVTLRNPFPFPYKAKVGQSRPVNAPIRIVNDKRSNGGINVDENTLSSAGLSLRNQDKASHAHITNIITIEPGKTINLRGDEAKVVIRQLTNDLLAYEGQTLRIGNPAYRHEAERKLVVRMDTIDNLLGGSLVTPRQQIDNAIAASNSEEAFPALKKPGRPRKDEQAQ